MQDRISGAGSAAAAQGGTAGVVAALRLAVLLCCCLFSAPALGGPLVITEPTVVRGEVRWRGRVELRADVLVPAGAVLRIAPGTEVVVYGSGSTKTQPEYLSSQTEVTVRGELFAEGTAEAGIRFRYDGPQQDGMGQWAGINVDGGRVVLRHCTVGQAESGVTVWSGSAAIEQSRLAGNRTGVSVLGEGAAVRLAETAVTANEYGLVVREGGRVELSGPAPSGNEEGDRLEWRRPGMFRPSAAFGRGIEATAPPTPYRSESLLGTVVWRDHVVVDGVIRVPAKSRLIIMPGTVVEFTRADSNGDGIGENGLLVMGMLVAKGTADRPIVFRSAASDRRMGDWDAINIYVSDGFQNLLEYCIIEDAYRGLHFHFSNVLVSHVEVRNCYRGLQFQESLVRIESSDLHGNKNALRARDSELAFVGNRVYGNLSGPNIFRVTGVVEENVIALNLGDGLRVREGAVEVRGNAVLGNRDGLLFAYANYGACTGNVVSGNVERGVILKGTENVRVEGNFIQGNGTNGLSLLRARGTIVHNQITGNGSRGIGIQSFVGQIRRNNLVGNGGYALGLEGAMAIDARENHWGGADLGRVIYDGRDEPGRGEVSYEPVLESPVPFTWPRPDILIDTVWQGVVLLPRRVDGAAGATITILPGTEVRFAARRGLWSNSDIRAVGEPERPIRFTRRDDEAWHQIMVERAEAVFRFCSFEGAETALHSHFSLLEVSACRFSGNRTGMMFKGGPVLVRRSLFTGNSVGIVTNFAHGEVTGCTIRGNAIGVMVRAEKNLGMRISGNNIFANSRYEVKMGDFNPGQDADFRDNYWGCGDPAAKIYDSSTEPGVGRVLYRPFLTAPVPAP